jgi:hypothetical protein
VSLRIDRDPFEECPVLEWAEDFTFEHREEVNGSRLAGVEVDLQRERTHDLEAGDSVDSVAHRADPSTKRLDPEGLLTCLKTSPVLEQLLPMNLGPRFNQALLPAGESTTERLDRVDGHDNGFSLVVRVEMRAVMLRRRFHEHTNDDPEESADLGHSSKLQWRRRGLMRGL